MLFNIVKCNFMHIDCNNRSDYYDTLPRIADTFAASSAGFGGCPGCLVFTRPVTDDVAISSAVNTASIRWRVMMVGQSVLIKASFARGTTTSFPVSTYKTSAKMLYI